MAVSSATDAGEILEMCTSASERGSGYSSTNGARSSRNAGLENFCPVIQPL